MFCVVEVCYVCCLLHCLDCKKKRRTPIISPPHPRLALVPYLTQLLSRRHEPALRLPRPLPSDLVVQAEVDSLPSQVSHEVGAETSPRVRSRVPRLHPRPNEPPPSVRDRCRASVSQDQSCKVVRKETTEEEEAAAEGKNSAPSPVCHRRLSPDTYGQLFLFLELRIITLALERSTLSKIKSPPPGQTRRTKRQ